MGTHTSIPSRKTRSRPYKTGAAVLFTLALTASGMAVAPSAYAATAVGLGTAGEYVVLGGQTVTDTGFSVLGGSLGVSPGTAAPGFAPNSVAGETNLGNAEALQAKADLDIAYDNAAGKKLRRMATSLPSSGT